jgi:DNA (cytosine-5)-methyltransferase 3A
VKHSPDKTGCITTVQKDNVISCLPSGRYPDVYNKLEEGKHYRYITPKECMRLQTIPEHLIDKLLSSGISNSQLYKMAGNGWTVDVISHILSYLKEEENTNET